VGGTAWNTGRAALAVATLWLLLAGLENRGLWAPDEPRGAQVAREMFSMRHGAGGLALLHLNREPYTEKPPLYYWLVSAASLLPGEVTERTARLPSALAGVATVAATVWLGTLLLDRRSALLGAALLLTVFKFSHLARRVQFDVLLTFFELGALAAFWRLDRGLGSAARNRLALHAGMGLALLTKGPVGFLIPVLSMAAYLGWERRLGDLRRAFSAPTLLVSLGPVLAWLALAVSLAPPDFFDRTVGTGLVGRYFEGTSHARPFYYYLYQFPVEFLPWTLLWPAVLVAGRRIFAASGADDARRRAWRFLLAPVAVSLVFFSISAGKRGLYLLPCFPAAALLCADSLWRLLAGRRRPPRPLAAGAALGGVGLVVLGIWTWQNGLEVAGFPVPALFCAVLVAAPLAGAVAWQAAVRRGALGAVPAVLVACAFAVEAAVFGVLYPAHDALRSMAPVAAAALRWTGPDEPIGLLGSESYAGGLAYYADRPISLLDEVEDLGPFWADGGRAVVMKTRKLPDVQATYDVAVRETLRDGDRALLVVVPAGDAPLRPHPPGS